MAKEVLIYGNIDEYSASQFIQDVNELEDGQDLTVRIATDGGDPEFGFGMIAKFLEFTGQKFVKVDGKAYSAGTFFCVYCDNVEALDVSEFLFHRAAYPSWFESEPALFTDAMKDNLKRVNDSLRKAMEGKIDLEALEQLKGVTLDDIFSMDDRIDVFLSAKEAKKIGLVTKITKITPKRQAEIESNMKVRMAARHDSNKKIEKSNPIKNMELTELKNSHPDLYAKVLEEGIAKGVAKEKDRVGSWMPFYDADPELITASIKSGAEITATAISELNVKLFSKNSLKVIESGNAKPVATAEKAIGGQKEQEIMQKQERQSSFLSEVRKNFGLETKPETK
jgi:ATP-dependent protease ClpP protease subunit